VKWDLRDLRVKWDFKDNKVSVVIRALKVLLELLDPRVFLVLKVEWELRATLEAQVYKV